MGASVKVTQFALRTTNGTTDITIAGAGTCKGAVFVLGGGVTDETVRAALHAGYGWVDSAGNASVGMTGNSEDNTGTSDTDSSWSAANFCIVTHGDTGAIDGQYAFDSFITDGIRITTTNPDDVAFLVEVWLFFGSDTTLVDGTITPSSSAGSEDTVDIGQDSDLLIWSHVDSTLATDTAGNAITINLAISTWDGTTIRQRGWRAQSVNNLTTSNIRQVAGPRLDFNFSSGTSINRAMECTTMDGDLVGITSRESDAPNDRPYRFLSVNFNGVIEARVEELEIPTSGNLAPTAYGFKPQFVALGFINVQSQVTESGAFEADNDCLTLVGAMDGTREHCVSVSDEDAVGTTNTASVTADNVLYGTNAVDTVQVDGDFSSFDTNGFTVAMNTHPASVLEGWGLAIEEEATGGTVVPKLAGDGGLAGIRRGLAG